MSKGRYKDTPDDTPFPDRVGDIYEIAGRKVKVVEARFGYGMWLISPVSGKPVLPLPSGHAQSLKAALASAKRFLDKLDSKRKWSS